MDRLRDYYEKIESRYTAEELSERVMNMETAEVAVKKRSPKRIAAIAACLAAVVGSTVVVGAATDWNYFGFFADKYGDDSAYLEEYVVSDVKIIKDTSTGYSYNLVAAATDGDSLYAVVDVFGADVNTGLAMFGIESDSVGYSGSCTAEYDEAIDGGVRITIRAMGNYGSDNIYIYTHNDKGEEWKVEIKVPKAEKEVYMASRNIGLPEVIYAEGKDSRLEENRTYIDTKIKMDMITISPISISLVGEYNYLLDASVPFDEKCYVELNSGEIVSIKQKGSRGEVILLPEDDLENGKGRVYGDICYYSQRPIDVSEVKRIVFDDEYIELSELEELETKSVVYENLTSRYTSFGEEKTEAEPDIFTLTIDTEKICFDGVLAHFYHFDEDRSYCITDDGEHVEISSYYHEGSPSEAEIEAVRGKSWFFLEKVIKPESVKTIVLGDRTIYLK